MDGIEEYIETPVKIKSDRPLCYQGTESGPGCKGCMWSLLIQKKASYTQSPCETRWAWHYHEDGMPRDKPKIRGRAA